MKRFLARAAFGVLAAVVFANATTLEANAQTLAESATDDTGHTRARALELFERSKAHYDRGEFREAATLLEQAYEAFPEPVLLYNLARAYQESGELEKALDAYERYLEADPEVKDRAGIEQRIVTLREQLRTTKEHGEAEPQDAVREPPLGVPANGAVAAVAQPRDSPSAKTPSAPDESSPSASTSMVPWLVAGAGVATLGAGVVLGLVANGHHANAEEEPDAIKAASEQQRAEDFATAANVTFVVGGVLAAAGTTWGVVVLASQPKQSNANARVRLAVGLAAARLAVDF